MTDGEAIRALIHSYAERLDDGDLDGVAALFAHSTWRTGERSDVFQGAGQVRRMYDGVILYDGRPNTKHLITNVSVFTDAADAADHGDDSRATARSYFTVLQATPELALQPIISGSYHDTFGRAPIADGGEWHFTDRLIIVDLVGDLSRHMRMDVGTPSRT